MPTPTPLPEKAKFGITPVRTRRPPLAAAGADGAVGEVPAWAAGPSGVNGFSR